ncbi:MAG: sigma-54-dependent transcriptional regulator, partial [Gammaproteobacteria bacterium]
TGADTLERLTQVTPEVVLLDLVLPDMDGMEVLRWMQERRMGSSVVIITAHGTVDTAIEATRLGAFDFLEKPLSAERLRVTVRNALDRTRMATAIETIKEDMGRDSFEGFIGSSLVMQSVYRIILSAAPSRASVFITGESGTGKEVCAEAIHRRSPRAEGPFVAINCAALPKDLMESEIFGHVKGAFTGALNARDGAASRADGGTLFLDEIGELDLDLQAKLLRFIQTGAFQKVGGSRQLEVDVRFLAATNRDPMQMVNEGRFREDLYYRLHVIPIALPPLREREDDVLLIARRFLDEFSAEEGKGFSRFDVATEQLILNYRWPGNVRELQNVVRTIVVLNDGDEVIPGMLPDMLRGTGQPVVGASRSGVASPAVPRAAPAGASQAIKPLWLVEKEAIEAAIQANDDNIPRAAAALEISPSTIYRKIQSWKN